MISCYLGTNEVLKKFFHLWLIRETGSPYDQEHRLDGSINYVNGFSYTCNGSSYFKKENIDIINSLTRYKSDII